MGKGKNTELGVVDRMLLAGEEALRLEQEHAVMTRRHLEQARERLRSEPLNRPQTTVEEFDAQLRHWRELRERHGADAPAVEGLADTIGDRLAYYEDPLSRAMVIVDNEQWAAREPTLGHDPRPGWYRVYDLHSGRSLGGAMMDIHISQRWPQLRAQLKPDSSG